MVNKTKIKESVAEFVKAMASQGKIGITWDYETDNDNLINLILSILESHDFLDTTKEYSTSFAIQPSFLFDILRRHDLGEKTNTIRKPNTDYIRVQALKELNRVDPDRINPFDDQGEMFNYIEFLVNFTEKMLMDKESFYGPKHDRGTAPTSKLCEANQAEWTCGDRPTAITDADFKISLVNNMLPPFFLGKFAWSPIYPEIMKGLHLERIVWYWNSVTKMARINDCYYQIGKFDPDLAMALNNMPPINVHIKHIFDIERSLSYDELDEFMSSMNF